MTRIARIQDAFSLVEVTLALGIAAVSMIAIFGLLVTGSQTNHTAVEQSASSDLLSAVAADLRATPKTSSTSPQYSISITSGGTLYFDSNAQWSASQTPNSRYRLTITAVSNGGGTRTASFLNLRMTWPAAASPGTATTGFAETFVALDRN